MFTQETNVVEMWPVNGKLQLQLAFLWYHRGNYRANLYNGNEIKCQTY